MVNSLNISDFSYNNTSNKLVTEIQLLRGGMSCFYRSNQKLSDDIVRPCCIGNLKIDTMNTNDVKIKKYMNWQGKDYERKSIFVNDTNIAEIDSVFYPTRKIKNKITLIITVKKSASFNVFIEGKHSLLKMNIDVINDSIYVSGDIKRSFEHKKNFFGYWF